MINALEELVLHTKNLPKIEHIKLVYGRYHGEERVEIEGTFDEVWAKLNFDYDNGYGSQELFGYIWYVDGTWSSRHEYDGAENWVYRKCPDKSEPIVLY